MIKTVRAPDDPEIIVFMAALPITTFKPPVTPNVDPALKNTQHVHS